MNINKYKLLEKILDKICKEAPSSYKTYHKTGKGEKDYARSRAYIHLFLMVRYGIFDFKERERLLTDGANDGGIDAYYIDTEKKIINIIQAKFRTNEKNFENKEIELRELRKMEINEIMNGNKTNTNGEKYSGKIQQFQRDIDPDKLNNRGRYKEQIIILSNLEKATEEDLNRYFQMNTKIFNYEKAYNELVFPLMRSEFFDADDLDIELVIQEGVGTSLQRYITTRNGSYVLTIMLIPVKEIGRIMNKYKNSLLRHNPRNYLAMSSGSVNSKIKQTIKEYPNTGEFSLYNNGITIFANQCDVKASTGKRGRGVVTLSKPQIINGGQTAYTLSTLYEEYNDPDQDPDQDIFTNKEVVVKIICPDYDEIPGKLEDHLGILKEISKSTNNQTPIEDSDMYSNDDLQIKLQKKFFEEYGLLYERKKGEFSQAILDGYLNKNQIIKRDELIKLYLSFKGEPSIKTKATKDVFARDNIINYDNLEQMDDIWLSYLIFKEIESFKKNKNYDSSVDKIGYSLKYGTNALIFAYRLVYSKQVDFYDKTKIKSRLEIILNNWKKFEDSLDKKEMLVYYKSKNVDKDVEKFFKNIEL